MDELFRCYWVSLLASTASMPLGSWGHYAHQPAYYRSCRGYGQYPLATALENKTPFSPPLMSGIRNMVTMTIALAGIASFVGAGGIDQRPDIINNKERFGDWEIDTIVGAFNKGAIVTLTERTTKMLLMKYLPNGKEAKGLAKAVIDLLICYLFLYL